MKLKQWNLKILNVPITAILIEKEIFLVKSAITDQTGATITIENEIIAQSKPTTFIENPESWN